MFERREHERRASDESARIVFDDDHTMECTVRDLSDSGACVEVSNTLLIPSMFKLVLSGGEIRSCRVAWRTRNSIGAKFA
jgi:hypothetical protein